MKSCGCSRAEELRAMKEKCQGGRGIRARGRARSGWNSTRSNFTLNGVNLTLLNATFVGSPYVPIFPKILVSPGASKRTLTYFCLQNPREPPPGILSRRQWHRRRTRLLRPLRSLPSPAAASRRRRSGARASKRKR